MNNLDHSKYHYFAFISYKREDEKWAKWLQKKLESYGFPVDMRKDNPSLPSKIRPIFRDKTDLTGGTLKAAIERGLEGSKYLIVICSPRAAQSPWVSKEVQNFINNGRENYIIPFIIGGTPNAKNPEEECFPEGLRQLSGEKEILGININEMGRDAAAIKVIAQMFGLRFDTLWQRHERAKRRKIIVWGTVAAIILVSSISAAAYMNALKNEAEKQRKEANEQRQEAEKQKLIAIKEKENANNQRDSAVNNKRKAEEQTKIAQQEKDRANKERERAEEQTEIAKKEKNNALKANQDLKESNRQLAEERDNVLKANWKMMENRALAVVEKANQLIDEGDSYTALALCSELLPKNRNNPEIPYVPEVEYVVRRGLEDCSSHKIYLNKKLDKLFFRPNSTQLICCGKYEKSIEIWDAETSSIIQTLSLDYDVRDISIAHNGKYLAAATYMYVYIWDLDNINDCFKIKQHSGNLKKIFFDNNNNLNVLYDNYREKNNYIEVYDIDSGEMINNYQVPIEYGHIIYAFSADGRYIATFCGYNKLILWDDKFNFIKEWNNIKDVNSLKFSPNNNYLAAECRKERLNVLKIDDSDWLVKHDFDILTRDSYCFEEDNVILIGGDKLNIWYLDYDKIFAQGTFDQRYMNIAVNDKVNGIENLFAAGSYTSGNIIIRRRIENKYLKDWTKSYIIHSPLNNKEYIYNMIPVNNENYFLLVSGRDTSDEEYSGLTIGHYFNFSCNPIFQAPKCVKRLSFSPDGNLCAFYNKDEEKIDIIETETGKLFKSLSAHKKYLDSYIKFSFSYNNKYLAYSGLIVSIETGEIISKFQKFDNSMFSPNGKYFYSYYKENGTILDFENNKIILSGKFNILSFSTDSKYLLKRENRSIELWDLAQIRCLNRIQISPLKQIKSATFIQDNQYILIQFDYSFGIWDRVTGRCIYLSEAKNIYDNMMFYDEKSNYIYYVMDRDKVDMVGFENFETLTKQFKNIFTRGRALSEEERRKYFLE